MIDRLWPMGTYELVVGGVLFVFRRPVRQEESLDVRVGVDLLGREPDGDQIDLH